MKVEQANSTGSVMTGSGRLITLSLMAGSGADATAQLNDNASAASGNPIKIAAATGTSHSLYLGPRGLTFENGLYLTLSGEGAEVYVFYDND
jgi:hypothetical protein